MRSMVLVLFFISEIAAARTIDCRFYTWKTEPLASFSKTVDLADVTSGFKPQEFNDVSVVKENDLSVAAIIALSPCLDSKEAGCRKLHLGYCDKDVICGEAETIFKDHDVANLTLFYSSHGSVRKSDFKLVCRTHP